MNTTRTEEKLLEEAARWSARLEAGDLTEFERADLQRWLRADAAHADAFAAAQVVSDGVAQLSRLDPQLEALADEAFAMGAADDARARFALPRWLLPAGGLAAAAVLAVLLSVGRSPGPAADGEAQIYEAVAAVRQVTLPDGSQLSLDAGARVSVAYARDQRRVELLQGRALFEVQRDRLRPFSVTADGVTTTALGTRFQVDRGDDAVTVVLSEGSVRVQDADRHSEKLVPGERLRVAANAGAGNGWAKTAVDADVATSWSNGRLVFRSTPLDEAVAEINRHSGVKLVLGDPALSDLHVSGNFVPGDGRPIASAFSAVLPLRVVESGGQIVLFLRHDDTGG